MILRIQQIIGTILLTFCFSSLSYAQSFESELSGTAEVPPNATGNTGSCTAMLDPARTQLTINCTHSVNFPEVVAAHIHNAPAGSNGPIVFTIGNSSSPTADTWVFTGTECGGGSCLPELEGGNLYFNFHSNTNPGGDIRGQIMFAENISVPTIAPLGLGLLALGLFFIGKQKGRRL